LKQKLTSPDLLLGSAPLRVPPGLVRRLRFLLLVSMLCGSACAPPSVPRVVPEPSGPTTRVDPRAEDALNFDVQPEVAQPKTEDCPRAIDPGDFAVQADPLEVLEGGPIVVRLTLRYTGQKPITTAGPRDWNGLQIEVHAPPTWQAHEARVHAGSWMIGPTTIKPGDSFVEDFPVHHEFAIIPPGRVTLAFSWIVHSWDAESRSPGKDILSLPSTLLALDVPEATPERISALRKRLEAVLDRKGHSHEDVHAVVNRILDTRHSDLSSVVFRLLLVEGLSIDEYKLRLWIYQWSRRTPENHTRLLQYLHDHGRKADFPVFESWHTDKVPLSEADIRTLVDAKDVWIRVLTYEHFPEKCPPQLNLSLERELQQLSERISREIKPEVKGSLETELEQLRQAMKRAKQ
jgi:hypothetical protein